MKPFTRIMASFIATRLPNCEEQQGFWKNRSTTDAIFIIRQVVEKAIEFSKSAFMCFVDLTKAFDRVRLNDVTSIMREENIPEEVVKIIEELNTNTKTRIMINNTLTEEVPVSTGIRQGDSLSPLLFNIIMDRIIKEVKATGKGFTTDKGEIKIICYADDAVLISENEDELQRMLYRLHLMAKRFNMRISIAKTKSLVVAKEPIRCKLAIDNEIVEQVMSFRYLGAEITADQNRIHEVKEQVNKASRIAGYLRNFVWKNNYMNRETKIRIYKTCIRPIMTYAAETRADTRRTKAILRTTEMRILRTIVGCTVRDRVRNEQIRNICDIYDIVRWTRKRCREWNMHVSRMSDDRLAKRARDGRPFTRRPPGRPPKRWRECWTSTSQEDQRG